MPLKKKEVLYIVIPEIKLQPRQPACQQFYGGVFDQRRPEASLEHLTHFIRKLL